MIIEEFEKNIDGLIYSACEGRVQDIRLLESGSYVDLLSCLDNFLAKVDAHEKFIEGLKNKTTEKPTIKNKNKYKSK